MIARIDDHELQSSSVPAETLRTYCKATKALSACLEVRKREAVAVVSILPPEVYF